jgi:glycosyltransferase involved in cell wall biosynthesis
VGPGGPGASVIVSTHNSVRSLEYVLSGYARQDCRDFEVVIADDGSREETRETIRRLRGELGLVITHVWQAHRGYYGKMAIMNRALVAARGAYVIAADGDVIPRHDFVRAHLEMRRPGRFVGGGDFRLSDAATKALTLDDVRSGRAFDYVFLLSIGQTPTRRRIKLWERSWVTNVMDAANVSRARFTGSNAGAWKADLLRVGGWDESYRAPGRDDTDVGVRLNTIGVRGVHSRYNTICLHMEHGQGNYSAEGRKRNAELLAETREKGLTRARIGVEAIVEGDHTVERR